MEFEGRNHALEELAGALQLAKKGLDHIKASSGKDNKYSHLTEEEVKKVEKAVQEKWTWLEEKRVLLAGTPRTQPPPVTVAQIRGEKQVFIIRYIGFYSVEHERLPQEKWRCRTAPGLLALALGLLCSIGPQYIVFILRTFIHVSSVFYSHWIVLYYQS